MTMTIFSSKQQITDSANIINITAREEWF